MVCLEHFYPPVTSSPIIYNQSSETLLAVSDVDNPLTRGVRAGWIVLAYGETPVGCLVQVTGARRSGVLVPVAVAGHYRNEVCVEVLVAIVGRSVSPKNFDDCY